MDAPCTLCSPKLAHILEYAYKIFDLECNYVNKCKLINYVNTVNWLIYLEKQF